MLDEAIIEGLVAKNEKAFRELVKSFQKNIFHTCLGFVHNAEDAEDIAQDVFIEVYRSVGNFKGNSKLSTWVYRIAVNKSLNHLRKYKQSKLMLSVEQLFTGSNHVTDASQDIEPSKEEDNVEKKEMKLVLEKAVNSLPENQRIAFTLAKYDDLSYLDIAEVMDMSLSAVESLIHRAKINLQKKLLKYCEGKY